jgi:hypothetical protein
MSQPSHSFLFGRYDNILLEVHLQVMKILAVQVVKILAVQVMKILAVQVMPSFKLLSFR